MTEEKMVSKIKKLLALGNDLAATEGERDNALRMAYKLMTKHNVDMARVEAFGHHVQEDRINFENGSWSWTWAKQTNLIIADLFFCKYYYSRKINGTQCIHHYVGRESNAATAAAMADYVVNSILKEGRKIYKQNTAPGTRAFAIGAMHKLHERVQEIKRQQAAQSDAESSGTALIIASLYQTEADANEELMPADLRVKKARAVKVDPFAYHAGKTFGESINLNLQVGEESRKLN